jgi:peptidase E
MTKFLLCGGNDRAYPEFLSAIQKEIYNFTDCPKVLSVMFSTRSGDRDEKFQSWKKWWTEGEVEFDGYELARSDGFIEQLERSNVIFFHGGDTKLMFEALEQFGDIRVRLNNKLIIGSSAGVFWLSKAFFSRSAGGWQTGKDIVPYNVMCHYGVSEQDNPVGDWLVCEKLIEKFNGDRPEDIVKLCEGQIFAYENH